MKKFSNVLLTLLTCGTAYALPLGNPADASLLRDGILWPGNYGEYCEPGTPCLSWLCDTFNVRFGFYGDYVFNHHTKVNSREIQDRIEKTEIFTNAGLVALNFWNRLDIFSTLGITNIDLETNAGTFGGTPGARLTLDTDSTFSWSVGARGTFWEWGGSSLGVETQYFTTNPRINRVTFQDTTNVYPDNLNAKYHEWQVGVGFAQRIHKFVPYIGVTWSRTRIDLDNADPFGSGSASSVILRDLKNSKRWGWATGFTIVDVEKMTLNIEGRFAAEKAVHVNAQIRF